MTTKHPKHTALPATELRITAFHMAANAVAACLIGRSAECSLHPCGCGDFSLGGPRKSLPRDLWLPTMSVLGIAYCGGVEPTQVLNSNDDLLDNLLGSVHAFWHSVHDGVLEHEGEEQALLVLGHVAESFVAIHPEVLRAVEAVAQALRLSGSLSKKQVERLVRDHVPASVVLPEITPQLLWPTPQPLWPDVTFKTAKRKVVKPARKLARKPAKRVVGKRVRK